MFDEIPEKEYVVQIPATLLYASTSVVFHVEPTERALTPILYSKLSKNDMEMGYNLHENEYGKFYEKFYVNYKNMMNAINVFALKFERVYDKVLMYKLHQDEYGKFEILIGSSKHICELEVLEKGILFSISLNYFYGVESSYKTVVLVCSLPTKELVPSNIVQLRVENKVPADMKVFSFISSTLHVKESLLTGDNEAVSKSVELVVGDVTFGEIISLRCIKIKEVCKTNKNHEEVYVIKGNVKGKWNASGFYTEESPTHQVLQHRDKSPPRFCGKNFKSFIIAKFEYGGGNIVLKQVNKGISESIWVYSVELYFQEVGNARAEIGKRIFLGLLGRCHISAGAATRVVHFSVAFQGNKIIDNLEDVVTEFIEGLVKNYPELHFSNDFPKVKVVLRSDASSKNDKISVISGGRSGHEPAHVGFMGKGMLASIICGDIFASLLVDPLIVKQYTGDHLNFCFANEQAKFEGYKVKMVRTMGVGLSICMLPSQVSSGFFSRILLLERSKKETSCMCSFLEYQRFLFLCNHPPVKIPVPVPPSHLTITDDTLSRLQQLNQQGRILEGAIEATISAIIEIKDNLNDWNIQYDFDSEGSKVRINVVSELVSDDRIVVLFAGDAAKEHIPRDVSKEMESISVLYEDEALPCLYENSLFSSDQFPLQ
ncbi:hypothetical protein AgCh_005480 [Apium graveolens]